MDRFALVVPVLPGMEERNKQFAAEILGPRRAEYEASRQRLGMTVERVWMQQLPTGDTVSIVYLESEDFGHAFHTLATSQEPFDLWWRQQILEIHRLDIAQPLPGPPNEQIFEYARG